MQTSIENDLQNTVKGAIQDFFKPFINLYKFFDNLSSIKPIEEDILNKLKSIEYDLSLIKLTEIEQRDEFRLLKNEVHTQKQIFKEVLFDFNKTMDTVSGNNFLSSTLDDSLYTVSSHVSILLDEVRGLQPRELSRGETLSHAAAELGLANIEYLLTRITKNRGHKPFLFGLNKGGGMLAHVLAHRMDLHQKYLVKCDYNIEYESIYCEDRDVLDSSIIIIDDVSRTGKTLNIIKEYLHKKYPRTKVYTVVLVSSLQEKIGLDSFIPQIDYAPWYSRHSTITFPWSKHEIDTSKSQTYFNDLEMDQIVGRLK